MVLAHFATCYVAEHETCYMIGSSQIINQTL
nr:MAG TPA: hypothetical protein [Caudoviricetes sp.]